MSHGTSVFIAALLAPMLATSAPGQADPAAAARMHVHVDARAGDDAAGDGTADKPFKTIARALALHAKTPSRATDIHLGLGHYGRTLPPKQDHAKGEDSKKEQAKEAAKEPEKDREAIPIVLPRDVSLVGFGSSVCEITGDYDQPLVVLADGGECRLSGMTLRGASTAVLASPVAPGASAPGSSVPGSSVPGSNIMVRAIDVAIRDCPEGFDLRPAGGSVSLRGNGLRVRNARKAIHATGTTHLDLDLERSHFLQCDEALALEVGGAPPTGAWHSIALVDCRFEQGSAAAIHRSGKTVVPAEASPWTIDNCVFAANQTGIALDIPNGDLPISITNCEFLENESCAIALVGSGEPLEGATKIENCLMRWNGIGLNALSCGRPVEFSRSRVEDSIGNGVFAATFVGRRSRIALTSCVLACNGACGFMGLSEQKDGLDVTLDHCTVVDNRGHGVERRNRRSGSSEFALTRCIVAGNAADLTHVEPKELTECLLGSGKWEGASGCVVGDPKFLKRSERDFRVATDSPARLAGGLLGALDDEGTLGGGGTK